MALWGNTDAIDVKSGGTVAINYDTGAVTGAGTSFGVTGFAQVGDILRVGTRVGTGTYFGDAVIVAVASTISCTIGSTIGLLHAGPNAHTSTGATTFQVSRLPKYTTTQTRFSQDADFNKADPVTTTTTTAAATGVAGVGTDIIPVSVLGLINTNSDALVNDGNNIKISSVNATQVSLASTISAGISTDDTLTFKRSAGGYEANVYAVAEGGKESAAGGQYQVDHAGWVGVTTYVDNHGNLRVKKETLVAMSGITTGNVPLYDSDPLA